MTDENSLGPVGPKILGADAESDLVYAVQGQRFAAEFRVEVRDGVGQVLEGVALANVSETSFTLTLPYAAPGPYTLVVVNPDARSSTLQFATPGTSASNRVLQADS